MNTEDSNNVQAIQEVDRHKAEDDGPNLLVNVFFVLILLILVTVLFLGVRKLIPKIVHALKRRR